MFCLSTTKLSGQWSTFATGQAVVDFPQGGIDQVCDLVQGTRVGFSINSICGEAGASGGATYFFSGVCCFSGETTYNRGVLCGGGALALLGGGTSSRDRLTIFIAFNGGIFAFRDTTSFVHRLSYSRNKTSCCFRVIVFRLVDGVYTRLFTMLYVARGLYALGVFV